MSLLGIPNSKPTRKLYRYLTDRIGNFEEMELSSQIFVGPEMPAQVRT
jgi:hypothetical protein